MYSAPAGLLKYLVLKNEDKYEWIEFDYTNTKVQAALKKTGNNKVVSQLHLIYGRLICFATLPWTIF